MAATPARLLPALRQPLPAQAAEFHHAFKVWGRDRPPAVRGVAVGRGAGVDALRPYAPLCGLFCPLWYKYSPAWLAPVLGGSAGL